MAKKANVDWTIIKAAYLNSNKSAAEVAKDFNLAADAVESQCHRGKWVEARRKLTEAAERKIAEEALAKKIKAIDDMNHNHITQAKMIQAASAAKMRRTLIRDENGSVVDCSMAAKDISAIAHANLTASKMERTGHGLNSENIGTNLTVGQTKESGMDALYALMAEAAESETNPEV